MTPIDQLRPPAAMPPVYKVQRKKRSARDSNRDQRPANKEKGSERNADKSEHIDKLI